MSLNNSNTNSSAKIQNFLESLRASRGANQSGNKAEQPGNPFKEIQAKKELEQRRIEQFHKARQQEWNNVYSAKDKEKEQKIESIRLQLKKLAQNYRILDKNIHKAIENSSPNPSVYEESFLDHIYSRITLLQKSANSANTWLEIYNRRSTKKGYYHQMAKSKGTSYTQNNERTVATSVG